MSEINNANGFKSNPIEWKPAFLASSNVVPDPHYGSKTQVFFFANLEINNSGI